MKLVHMASGLAVAIALAACADKNAGYSDARHRLQIRLFQQHNNQLSSNRMSPVPSGSIQKVALPPDAVLTVTLSDASLADAPSKVLAQKAVRTEGKQSPFSFVLPFNPADVSRTRVFC